MPCFGSNQIRCSLVQKTDIVEEPKYILSTLDGEVVNEIDIGQTPWPHHWPETKKSFTWKFIDNTPDMRAREQRQVFQQAYNSFEKLTNIDLDYEKNVNTKTDSTVEWLEDIATFDNKLSVLAHAYLYFPNSNKNGVIEFNDSPQSKWYFTPLGWPVEAYLVDPVNFTKGQRDGQGNLIMRASQPTLQIAMHEIFHALLGRHDLKNPNESLMGPYVKRGYIGDELQKESFYWDKISSIPRMQERFGSSNIIDRHLARWRQRRVLDTLYKRI